MFDEARFFQMNPTERELYSLREDYYKKKMSGQVYDEAVDCSLFWAVESGRITEEESVRLYNRYRR